MALRLLVLVLGSVLVAATAFAAKPSGHRYEPAVDDRRTRELIADMAIRQQREKDERNTPEARRQRKVSRTVYSDLAAADARDVLRRKFSSSLKRQTRPLDLKADQHVDEYLGDNAARIALGPGKGFGIVDSTLPLRARDGNGQKRLVDLTLDHRDGAYRSRNPLVSVRLPERLEDGIAFERAGFSLRPTGAAAAAVGEQVGDSVVYANVARDTDFIAVPERAGVETFQQLRSADSPEEETLAFDLPSGARLRQGEKGVAEIVRAGEVIGVTLPPIAKDADGRAVPTTMSLSGDSIVVRTPHRDKDYAYPILVDPFTQDGRGLFYDNQMDTNPGGWSFNILSPPGSWWLGWYDGRLVINANGGRTYKPGDTAYWVYRAPGTAYIYRADFQSVSISTDSGSGLYEGIYKGDASGWENGVWYDTRSPAWNYEPSFNSGSLSGDTKAHCVYSDCLTARPGMPIGSANAALFMGGVISEYYRCCSWFWAHLSGAEVYMDDPEQPHLADATHTNRPSGWTDSATPSLSATATDPGLGITQIDLNYPKPNGTTGEKDVFPDKNGNQVPDGDPQDQRCKGEHNNRCPNSFAGRIDYSTDWMREGKNTLSLFAFDLASHKSGIQNWPVRVDRSPPTVTLTDKLAEADGKAVYDGVSYPLHVDATDGATSSDTAARSGVKKITIYDVYGGQERVVHEKTANPCTADRGSCPLATDWTFTPDRDEPGPHTIKVVVCDWVCDGTAPMALRHETTRLLNVIVDPLTQMSPDQLGLEDYFHYYSTETGAGTRAHVNLASGNVVWHAIPLVNPGRGLSSVVNLTYNSQTPTYDANGTLIDTPKPYRQAGIGFSIGISGLTRVNEPLDLTQVARGLITLTDRDGTRHRFLSYDGGNTYQHPPGVNVHLRRYSPTFGSGYQDRFKVWAATRPDGVTHFFDAAGYETSIVDRNGNTLRFDYQYFSRTGSSCTVSSSANPGRVGLGLDGLPVCPHRLRALIDATGAVDEYAKAKPNRSVDFTYENDPITDGLLRTRIKTITDHLGRTLGFNYNADDTLVSMTQGSGARSFGFGYEDPAGLSPLDHRYLTSISDPRAAGPLPPGDTPAAHTTKIKYEDRSPGVVKPLRAEWIQDRGNSDAHRTRFSYLPNGGGCAATVCTKVRDPLDHATDYSLDERSRLIEMTDARGATTRVRWNNPANAGERDDNNVAEITEPAGTTGGPAVTRMTYNQNGLLASKTDPLNHVTQLGYRDGPGTQLSGVVSETGDTFVSDLVSITSARGHTTHLWPDCRGNVLQVRDPENNIARTEYDPTGQVTAEIDWHPDTANTPFPQACNAAPEQGDGNKTTYESYDASGFPQAMVDPRGNAAGDGGPAAHRWRFSWDVEGNLKTVTDPRGATSGQYTTTLVYDSLDRLIDETRPKDSSNTLTPGDGGDATVARHYAYDKNDNVTSYTDGAGKTTTRTYSAMDDPATIESPPVAHKKDSSATVEKTSFQYDVAHNLTKTIAPLGNEPGATPGSYETENVYDAVNQVVARIRRSRVGDQPGVGHVTSYAYDLRGNLVGLVDPRNNAKHGGVAQDNALDPLKRRFTYEYDEADRRRAAIEDTKSGGFRYRTEMDYDEDDNVTLVKNPRGFTTTYTFDRADRLTATTDAAGGVTRQCLRPDGKPFVIIKPNGQPSPTGACNGSEAYGTRLEYFPTGEVKSVRLPRAPGQYGSEQFVTYERNAVGDPTKITDARGRSFVNEFFDTGELRSTERPSFWDVNPAGAGDDSPAADAGNAQPGPAIEEPAPEELASGQRSASLTDDKEDIPQTGTPVGDPGGGDFGSVGRQDAPDLLPKAGKTLFAYDGEMRLTAVEDAVHHGTTIGYDGLGRMVSLKQPFEDVGGGNEDRKFTTRSFFYDAHGNLLEEDEDKNAAGDTVSTTYEYDQFDRRIRVNAPGYAANQRLTTSLFYDENDNQTHITPPRGLTWRRTYDDVDRLASETNPLEEQTKYEAYDAAGNLERLRSPKGHQTTYTYDSLDRLQTEKGAQENVTSYAYDRDGNVKQVVEPGAKSSPANDVAEQVTKRTYDGRDLPWATTTGSGDHKRTTITEFDGNGNLRRVVNPAGVSDTDDGPRPANADNAPLTTKPTDRSDSSIVGAVKDASRNATLYEYSADNVMTATHMPWGRKKLSDSSSSDDTRLFRRDFEPDALGRVKNLDAPFEWTKDDSTARTSYAYYDNGWVKTATDPDMTDADGNNRVGGDKHEYVYDKQGDQTRWCVQTGAADGCSGSDGERRIIEREYFLNGLLKRRTAKKNPSDTTPRSYDYQYGPNGTLSEMVDDDLDRTTRFAYDNADRNTRVNEVWSTGKDTGIEYDPNGNVEKRRADGRFTGGDPGDYAGGKTTEFDYDSLDLERKSVTTPANSDDGPARTVETDYWPSRDPKVKRNWTGATEPDDPAATELFYADDGDMTRMRRTKKNEGDPFKDQHYGYDPNGNRSEDERGTHGFNARDQLTSWDKRSGGSVSYELNGSGAVTKKTDGSEVTTYNYLGKADVGSERLLSVDVNGTKAHYCYKDFNVTKISPTACGDGGGNDNNTAGNDAISYTYDDFDRLQSTKSPQEADSTTYHYDGLDRRDFKCVGGTGDKSCTGGKRNDFGYVGISHAVSMERDQTRAGGVGRTRSYDYDSSLRSLGIQTKDDGPVNGEYRPYAKDAAGSIEALEDASGAPGPGDSYAYDPYGDLTNEGSLSDEAKDNPFRFEGFYADSGVKSYDMHAREYRPAVGRFLTRDRFESSLDDLNLEADPLTQERYAFAGGNPISNIEFDGHYADAGGGVIYGPNGKTMKRGGGRVDNTPSVQRTVRRVMRRVRRDARPRAKHDAGIQRRNRAIQRRASALAAAVAGLFRGKDPEQIRRPSLPPEPSAESPWTDLTWVIPAGVAGKAGWSAARAGRRFIAGLFARRAAQVTDQEVAQTRGLLARIAKGPFDGAKGTLRVNQRAGAAAEGRIASSFPGSQTQVTLQTSSGARRIDVLTARGHAIESKVGRTSLTGSVERQIHKDLRLLSDPTSPVRSLEWRFATSPRTGRIGPTQPLAKRLRQAGIRIMYDP